MTSTLLTILPGQDGGGRRVGLAEHDDAGRRRVGGARPGGGDEQRQRAGEAQRDQGAVPVGSIFCCSHQGLQATTPAFSQGCGTGFCRSPRLGGVLRRRLHDPSPVGLPAEMEGTARSRRVHPRRPRLARNRGRRGRPGCDGAPSTSCSGRRSSSCSPSTPRGSSRSAAPICRRRPSERRRSTSACARRPPRSPPARSIPASCSTPRSPGSRSATRRSTRSSRPSPSARARCSPPRPTGRCTACRS